MVEFEKVLFKYIDQPGQDTIDTYINNGGYKAIEKAFSMNPEEITEEVIKSGLRGRGGAGFPAGRK